MKLAAVFPLMLHVITHVELDCCVNGVQTRWDGADLRARDGRPPPPPPLPHAGCSMHLAHAGRFES